VIKIHKKNSTKWKVEVKLHLSRMSFSKFTCATAMFVVYSD